MPRTRRAMRCIVDLSLHAVSAPGVWLPSKEDVYLSVSLLGQYRNSCLLTSVFPLLIHEKFRFEKTFYTALDPAEVADCLEDEVVVFELVQLSEYTDGAISLASYSVNAREFLFPYPSLAPRYSSTDREILLARCSAFPGISPKLEFATKTVIRESISPEVDYLEDAVEHERGRQSRRSRSRSRRPRSSSLSHKLLDLNLSDTIETRPPFVVRKMSKDLIGRVPGGGPDAQALSKDTKYRSVSSSRDDLDISILKRRYHLEQLLSKPLPSYTSMYSAADEDAEVSELTSKSPRLYTRIRPRSASPVLTRPSFRARYGVDPYSPSYYSTYSDIVRRRLEEARLARVYDVSYSSYLPYYSSYRRCIYEPSLYDLELSTNLAKSRRYYPLY